MKNRVGANTRCSSMIFAWRSAPLVAGIGEPCFRLANCGELISLAEIAPNAIIARQAAVTNDTLDFVFCFGCNFRSPVGRCNFNGRKRALQSAVCSGVLRYVMQICGPLSALRPRLDAL
jgi:hypothetical protein